MKSISPKAHFRQRVIKYSAKNGVTAASIRYRVCRKAIYDWKKRYDGRWQSLIDRSHRPHSHPRQQTAEEYAMIERYYRRTKDKMMLWDKLRENGYTRCYNSLLRAIKRLKLEETPEKRKAPPKRSLSSEERGRDQPALFISSMRRARMALMASMTSSMARSSSAKQNFSSYTGQS